MENMVQVKKLAIYVHIPFCKQKCMYCDFTSFSDKEEIISQYVDKLLLEIKEYSKDCSDYIVSSVYFGGGTPSFINSEYIKSIFSEIKEYYNVAIDCEVTIEANPGTVDLYKLKSYIEVGFNRISFGVQSLQDEILKKIGRIHSSDDAVRSFMMAREAGFNNISLDLMFGLPGQTYEDLEATLNGFIGLSPEHISAYSLKVEENTAFGKLSREGNLELPSEELERSMYYLVKNKLKLAGYDHYEISNFGKRGFYSRHNLAYWKRQDYLGFGLGASSCFKGTRFSNTEKLWEYFENFKDNIKNFESLGEWDINSERVILGLRMLEGIDKELFVYDEWKKSADKLIKLGLLQDSDNKVTLTDRGLDLANQVFVEFI